MRRREGPRERPEICWYLAERPLAGRKSRWHREMVCFALDCNAACSHGLFVAFRLNKTPGSTRGK